MTSQPSRRFSAAVSAVALALAAVLLVPAPASGAEFDNVATEAQLRDAILAANANDEADVIRLSGTGFALTQAPPTITSDITIIGPGADAFVLDASNLPNNSPVLVVSGADSEPITVTLEGFEITETGERVRAIDADWVNLTLTELKLTDTSRGGLLLDARPGTTSVITDVTASGSIYGTGFRLNSYGDASVEFIRVRAMANSIGFEPVVEDQSSLLIEDSTISGNSDLAATGGGLRISVRDEARAVVRGTTIDSNEGWAGGGVTAFLGQEGTLRIEHSTISGNTATTNSGGIFVDGINSDWNSSTDTYAFELRHSTVVGNTRTGTSNSAGGLALLGSTMLVEHSIIAGNSHSGGGEPNLMITDRTGSPLKVVANHSLIQSVQAQDSAVPPQPVPSPIPVSMYEPTEVISGVPAELGPLADNGGPTLTHLPLLGSPVIDAGNGALDPIPDADQRGYERVVDTIDIGAVEFGAEELPPSGPGDDDDNGDDSGPGDGDNGGDTGTAGSSGTDLPATGADTGPLLTVVALAMLAGLALVLRRRTASGA